MVVLSEERGEIRLAESGQISDPLPPSEAEARITAWMEAPGEEETAQASTSQIQRVPVVDDGAVDGGNAP